MGVYADSSPDLFDDPKVETVVELLKRIWVRDLAIPCCHLFEPGLTDYRGLHGAPCRLRSWLTQRQLH